MKAKIESFKQYEVLATLVKYGNLYQTKRSDSELWEPMGDDVRVNFFGDEKVRGLVAEGLAEHVDCDPQLALGKVVPLPAAKETLEAVVLTREMKGVGVHLSHCCVNRHGCKYGNEFCPVEQKILPPDYAECGACYEDDMMDRETVEHLSDHILIEELERRGFTVTGNED